VLGPAEESSTGSSIVSANGGIDEQSDAQPMGSSTGPVRFEDGSVSDSGAGESINLDGSVPAIAGEGYDSSAYGSTLPGGSLCSCDATYMGFGLAYSISNLVASEEPLSLGDECSLMSECLSSSDIFDEAPGFAEDELIGDVTVAKSLAVSARKDAQSWFFGWLRAGVQHDEKLLAKLDIIVERMSRTKLDALSPDCSMEMLQMREKLASMDVERRQAMATAWLSLQA
jgi:hypothetical protein